MSASIPEVATLSGLTPAPERDETERVDPQPTTTDAQGQSLVLANGARVELQPLKLRQFLRLLRILTRGAAANMDAIDLDMEDSEKFIAGLLSLLLFAIPEAEDETVDFLQSIVTPAGLTGDAAADDLLWTTTFENLVNPSLDDTLSILQRLVEVEGEDIRGLGKRVRKMFTVAMATGAIDQNKGVKVP